MKSIIQKALVLGALQTNCYIIGDGTHCAVIDPADNAQEIIAQADGMTISKILLTHTHFDHMEALQELYLQTSAEVCVSHADSFGLTHPQLNLSSAFGSPFVFDGKFTTLSDRQAIKIGSLSLCVLLTPGHTPGSVCFIYDEGKTIYSGDTVFMGSIGRTDFPGGDQNAMQASLELVLTYPDEYIIYPGHGYRTTVLAEKSFNPYYRHF